jgi:carbon-monoxide dehydrogenase medium subunit
MWKDYYSVTTVDEVLQILADKGDKARIVAGATDLILEIERGVRRGIETLIDVTRIPDLDKIVLDDQGWIHLGPTVTHNDCVASNLIRQYAFPLAQATFQVGAPQIRNRGTITGNLVTASPANDSIPPLMVLGAQVTLRSLNGERVVALKDFYTGVRGTVMQADEMLVDISFPIMKSNQRGNFIKLSLRRAQAISLVNAAVNLTMNEDALARSGTVKVIDVKIALGAVAPTIIFAQNAQDYLNGKELNEQTINRCAELAMHDAKPIDDLRGTAEYRREMVRVCVSRSLHDIMDGNIRSEFPDEPILLDVHGKIVRDYQLTESVHHKDGKPIITHINGVEYTFNSGQDGTLLQLIREEAGLMGTKEGCDEGECGACTVYLDGKAVMSCLVPAVRAHGAEITTIEGIGQDNALHPVQEAFIEEGAVQCGYCTPGFIMSGAMLLEEQPNPTEEQIKQALSGNLCRCTGYYKIIQAIEKASEKQVG